MSTLDPKSQHLQRTISDRIESRRSDILRQAAHDLELEGQCRTLINDTPSWTDAVEYLRVLALGEEGRHDAHR